MSAVIGRWLACAVVLWAARPVLADEGTARAAFRQAEDLRKAGKWMDACPLYAASYHDDPQLGVLLHLAECHEKVGALASAWLEFTDAVELAKQRHDPREADAKTAADALLPRLAKLHVTAPPRVYAGLVVKRDGVDMTVLVGTDAPVDPGDHELVVTAPGFTEWKTKVAVVGEGKVQQVAIPELVAAPAEKPAAAPPPAARDGALSITASRPDARISIDQKEVGSGRWRGRIATGGHTLRVVAPGAHVYQTEIFVDSERERSIDVPLEAEVPVDDLGPRAEVALAIAPGIKVNADRPKVLIVRGEVAFRIGRRLRLGVFGEYGSIETSAPQESYCGTDFHTNDPTTPYVFNSCSYVFGGVKLDVHLRPRESMDPYVGFGAGGGLTSVSYTAGTMPGTPGSEDMIRLFGALRAGVEFHPIASTYAWSVGPFAELQYGPGKEQQANIGGGPVYASMFIGARTAWAFF